MDFKKCICERIEQNIEQLDITQELKDKFLDINRKFYKIVK